jgi:CheY-like chemotaxis protein
MIYKEKIQTIAIVDDDKQARESLAEMLELLEFNVFLVDSSFDNIGELSQYIRDNSQATICDHRLGSGLASFTGSQLMPLLYESKFPSILMSQYTETDINVSIRKYRHQIPVLLERGELVDINIVANKLKNGFETCSQEFQGIMSSARRPHRALIRVIDITTDSGEDVAEVFVPDWNRHHAVRFPVSQIPDDLLATVKIQLGNNQDSWLIARVNTEAEKSEDLYFTLFESAPELDDNDGLA